MGGFKATLGAFLANVLIGATIITIAFGLIILLAILTGDF